MKESVLNKILELKELAKHNIHDVIDRNVVEASSEVKKETALSLVIKTKKDADLFMKRLRALG
jgi:hypothetical protein